MSVLICSTTYGGCGRMDKAEQFGGTGEYVICPSCGEDHAFSLNDQNFDTLTSKENRVKARALLDEDNAGIYGDFLKFCLEEGYIHEENLTPKQRRELRISPPINTRKKEVEK